MVTVLTTAQNQQLETLLTQTVAKNHGWGGGVLRIENARTGEMLWQGATGTRAHGASEAVLPNDSFEVASITKPVVSALALKLAEQGKLDFQAPLATLPLRDAVMRSLSRAGCDRAKVLTADLLARQRSGLPNFAASTRFAADYNADPQRFWQPDATISYIEEMPDVGVVGKTFHYADTNFTLLSLACEAVTGARLPELLQEQIFEPLQLCSTYLRYHQPGDPPMTHRYEGARDLSAERGQSVDYGGGGLVSTAADLACVMRALHNRTLLNDTSHRLLTDFLPIDEVQSGLELFYGYGVFALKPVSDTLGLPKNDLLWGHNGHGSAFMFATKHSDLIFTGTLNQNDTDWRPMLLSAAGIVLNTPV